MILLELQSTSAKQQHLNTNLYIIVHMGTQISLKISDKMFSTAQNYAKLHGYESLQDLIREVLREKLFEAETQNLNGLYTYLASEKSLAHNWLTKEEDEAWAHFQKET